MPLLTKVGSFVKRDGTGAQAITGLGFTPKAVVFWTAGSSAASGTWDPDVLVTLGFTAGAANSFAVATVSADNISTAATSRRMAAKAITFINTLEAVPAEADLSSFDADGFTLNWTTNAADPAFDNVVINFLALGGSDLSAKVVNWAAGSGDVSATGAGFTPDLVLHAASFTGTLTSGTFGILGFGAMNKHGQQWANGFWSGDAASPSNTSRFQQTDACLVQVDANEGIGRQAHFVSMDTDGFTVKFSAGLFTGADQIVSLCLKGVSSKVAAFRKTQAAAPAAQSVTRVGFQPKAVLFTGFGTSTSGAPTNHVYHALLGGSDGTTQRAASLIDPDALNPTNAESLWRSDAVYAPAGQVGSLTSLDADGYSLSFSVNDVNDPQEVLYLALGDAGVNTFPTRVVG